VVHRHYSAI